MDYEMIRQQQDAIRRSVERDRLALDARRARAPRAALRLILGTALARLGLRLAGQTAVRGVLGEVR
jgi:hypothetical protein